LTILNKYSYLETALTVLYSAVSVRYHGIGYRHDMATPAGLEPSVGSLGTDVDVTFLGTPSDILANTFTALKNWCAIHNSYTARLEWAYRALLDRHHTCAVDLATALAEP
jgi:hypothetical protein